MHPPLIEVLRIRVSAANPKQLRCWIPVDLSVKNADFKFDMHIMLNAETASKVR
jgi:hypothetical protein